MIKGKTLLFMTAAIVFMTTASAGTLTVEAADNRIFDEAGLFTEEEKTELQELVDEVTERINMDLTVVTTEDALGKTSEQFAEDYYEEGGFGTDKDHSGALCLIDMDNRELFISTEGEMIRYITDDRVESIMDDAIGYISSGEYARGMEVMIGEVDGFVEQGIVSGQYNYDRDTGKVSVYHKRSITWYEALFALMGAGIIAIFPCISTVKQYKMESERRQALNYHLAYKGASAFAFTTANDLLVNKVMSQRRIVQSTGGPSGSGRSGGSAGRSTTHRSGGGRSHGGGGRGF